MKWLTSFTFTPFLVLPTYWFKAEILSPLLSLNKFPTPTPSQKKARCTLWQDCRCFPLLDMKPDVYTVHVRHPAFLLGMLLMLLRYSSLRTHLLLRFFIRFGDMQKQRKVLLWGGRPRTPAVSEMELFVTIVTEWLINSYYYKELHLMCCSGPRCHLLIPEKGF